MDRSQATGEGASRDKAPELKRVANELYSGEAIFADHYSMERATEPGEKGSVKTLVT